MRNRNTLSLLLGALVVLVLLAFGGTGVLNQLTEVRRRKAPRAPRPRPRRSRLPCRRRLCPQRRHLKRPRVGTRRTWRLCVSQSFQPTAAASSRSSGPGDPTVTARTTRYSETSSGSCRGRTGATTGSTPCPRRANQTGEPGASWPALAGRSTTRMITTRHFDS
jgi:hypothetical protein